MSRRVRITTGLLILVWVCAVLATYSWRTEPVAAQTASTSCLGGAVALPAPGGANVFLTFLEHFSPEDAATADAYYQATDPFNRRLTLRDWLETNEFLSAGAPFGPGVPGDIGDGSIQTDALAVYLNGADLGFGRRMYLRRNADGALASYVENYGFDHDNDISTPPRFEGVADLDILDSAETRTVNDLIATVCMEYKAPDDDPTGPKRVTFYTYAANGSRVGINGLNLDGRGDKAQPGVCNVCHGGAPKPPVNGVYPDKGNTDAYFLPWDVATFKFDTRPGSPFTREAQESQFKNFNEAVLRHHEQQLEFDPIAGINRRKAPVELIRGWYGGATMPNDTFNEDFVPLGWRPSDERGVPAGSGRIYREVIGPYCRACHIQRERSLDFATYKGFITFKAAIQDLVYTVPFSGGGGDDIGTRPGDDRAVMPLALRTYNNFWNSNAPELLCKFLARTP
ncbi:MAG TPA: hypothetical protein VK886_15225 [Vicinamibacterales bacterium]|nr:hypothetical protein [Vicinamibacterales bacterium]